MRPCVKKSDRCWEADVPFCIMGQAAYDKALRKTFSQDPLAAGCALATGIGTELTPLKGVSAAVVLSKPPIHVSTGEVYQGLQKEKILCRPNTVELIAGLAEKDWAGLEKNMINVLEFYTLRRYDNVVYTKNKMKEESQNGIVLMSGSGPTVYALFQSKAEAETVYSAMKSINRETFLTETTP